MDEDLNRYLVFSVRPDGVSEADYDRWYVKHAQENIESPGFVSARRYGAREVVGGEPVGAQQHLAIYEFEGDMSRWRTDLTARIKAGDVDLPDWFPQIQFKSWVCSPRGGLLHPSERG